MNAATRVLIVDDSAFARKVIREVLSRHANVEVIGVARDGLEALEKINELSPDVITLDLVMPNLDGLGVLDALTPEQRARVVVVSTAGSESELAVTALQRGAFDLVNKPTALASERLYELGAELVIKLNAAAARALASARPVEVVPPSIPPPLAPLSAGAYEVLVIGTSTGGPQALSQLLTALPANFPLPIVVALHIPAGYTDALARRIDAHAALEVREAENGIELIPGRAVIARGGSHLRIKHDGEQLAGFISNVPSDTAHFPSVNVLFESAVAQCGAKVVGVVLTGMGDDGRAGAAAIHAAGGLVISEAASSCVVYGMPRAVADAGLSHAVVALPELAAFLSAQFKPK